MSRTGKYRCGHTLRHGNRSGTIYIAVLGAATIVMILGLSGLTAVRIKTRIARSEGQIRQARIFAHSAVQLGLFHIQRDADWRNTFSNDTWIPSIYEGHKLSWKIVDEQDGNLADDPTEPVRVHGKGVRGSTVQLLSVVLEVTKPDPIEPLRTAVHSDAELHVKRDASLTVTGAPASSNGKFQNDGMVLGSVEATHQAGGGIVTDIMTISALTKDMPDVAVFNDYRSRATEIPHAGHIDRQVLTPKLNEYVLGRLNADGVYYINTDGRDLQIKNARIHGTLVVDAGAGKVILKQHLNMRNFRSDYPVLIVLGAVEINIEGGALDEVTYAHNFNPIGAPYQGHSDSDQFDRYASEIRGLVHATGNISFPGSSSKVVGTVIAQGDVAVSGNPQIHHNLDLVVHPPKGYSKSDPGGKIRMVPGSWRKVTN